MRPPIARLLSLSIACLGLNLPAAPFDAAPFGLPLPEGNGVMWEDPREIHTVIVRFAGTAPAPGAYATTPPVRPST